MPPAIASTFERRSLLWLDRGWRNLFRSPSRSLELSSSAPLLFNKRIGVTMKEFPHTVLPSKDLRDSQSTRSRFLLIDHTHVFLVLYGYGERQITTDAGVKVFEVLLGPGFFEVRRRPIAAIANFVPTLFMPTKRTEHCGIVAVRGILLPQSGIAVDKTNLGRLPLRQERWQARVASGGCGSLRLLCAAGQCRSTKHKQQHSLHDVSP